jgi:O-antigen ligase
VLFVLWTLWRSTPRTRIAAAAAIGVAVLLVSTLAPPELLARIGSAVNEFAGAGERGETIWRRSLQVWNENPIVGVGLDAHRMAVPIGFHITQGVAHSTIGKEAHNTFISILVETGVVGFAIFMGIAVVILRSVARAARPVAFYWATQLSVIAIGAQTLSLEDSKAIWYFCGLAVAATVPGLVRVAQGSRASSTTARVAGSQWRASAASRQVLTVAAGRYGERRAPMVGYNGSGNRAVRPGS